MSDTPKVELEVNDYAYRIATLTEEVERLRREKEYAIDALCGGGDHFVCGCGVKHLRSETQNTCLYCTIQQLRAQVVHEDRLDEPTVQEREDAEESLSQAYFLITGRSPEWSNLFGHAEALEEIDDAQTTLRKEITGLRAQVAERDKTIERLKRPVSEETLEALAAFEHERWSNQAKAALYDMTESRRQRWTRQAHEEYAALTEAEKELDRVQVRSFLALIQARAEEK